MTRDAYDWIILTIQGCALLGLVYYAIETFKIRRAAQAQVEAALRPCVVISSAPRPLDDTLMEMDQTDSTAIVSCRDGLVQIQNIGVAPAFNIRYQFTAVDKIGNYLNFTGYVAGIAKDGQVSIPVFLTLIQGHDFHCLLSFESASGHRYSSRATLRNLVITNVRFDSERT